MNINYHQTKGDRSYFEWGDNMQIICKGKGEIAMTESELVEFFCVTWRKLNYRLQQLLKVSSLRPDERDTGELEVFVNGRLQGYAPLYPLSSIIAMSYQLDSMEAYFFRKYICQELQRPASVMEQIFLIWTWQHQLICFSLSPILSYYITTRKGNTVKGKGWYCSQKVGMAITTV